MIPVNFNESNLKLLPPANDSSGEVMTMEVHSNNGEYISCWEFSDADLEEVNRTRKMWVRLYSGKSVPPIGIQTENPFVHAERAQRQQDVINGLVSADLPIRGAFLGTALRVVDVDEDEFYYIIKRFYPEWSHAELEKFAKDNLVCSFQLAHEVLIISKILI